MSNNWYEMFTKFFIKYFIFGISFILISIIYKYGIEKYVIDSFWYGFFNIFYNFFSIMGPTLIVASLFSFSIESKSFIEYIKEQIEKVMISKEFLDKLSLVDKKSALQRILAPNDEHYQIFSNIKNYFDETIEKNLILFEYNFKTHLTINISAKYNADILTLHESFSYRIYKGKNGFKPINFGFQESDSSILSMEYATQNGNIITIEPKEFQEHDKIEESGAKWKLYTYNLPSDITSDYITLYSKTIETGQDHWQIFGYKTILPSEGLNLILNCEDDIIVKEHMIFDNDKNYLCKLSPDNKKIEINTTQWLSPGSGLSILVAKK